MNILTDLRLAATLLLLLLLLFCYKQNKHKNIVYCLVFSVFIFFFYNVHKDNKYQTTNKFFIYFI